MKLAPRDLNVLLGIWLFFSAFLWPHPYAQMINTWILGVLCVVFAVVAMVQPPARYLNTVVGVWVFVSAWALPWGRLVTVWNNVIVGIAIFTVSLLRDSTTDDTLFHRPHAGT